MADLTAQLIANSYKNLLQAPGTNGGIGSGQSVTVEDGAGVPSGLALSTNGVGLSGNITIQGSLFTGTGTQLNTAIANAGTLVNGIVAQNGAQSFGRTLVGTAGVTITNANGGAGNPTFALVNTSVSAGTYVGGSNTFTIDAQGRVTDVTATTTISANAFIGGTFSGSSLYVENNVSVSGSLNVAGAVSIAGAVHIDGATSINNDLDITGTFTADGPAIVKNIITSVVSASYLYGDGSNITGLAGAGTMTALTAGTGIHIIENGTTVTGITGSGTVVINADQSFGTVSATSFIIGGDNVALSATVATLSATMATSIDNSNVAIAAVSALTSVNAANITTNINAITSVNNVITALSGTLATSISNATGNITALSATMATSIDNTNTNLTALSATMATSIANHLPLAGGTMTGAITLPGNPSANLEAATKQYVDNLTAAAIHFHDAVRLESPINLNGTYNNGTAGVGATLTNAGTQTALVIDGIAAVVADRVLIYQQTDQTQNGVYTVTDIGSGSTNWVLTRSTDADTYSPGTNSGLDEGSYFYVQEGDTGAGEAYVCNTVGTITFGTTNITFVQFSSALVYSAGSGININASRVISVSGVPSSATIAALSATMATSISNHMPKSGGTFTGNVSHGDNIIAQFGASNDLQIYHNGSDSWIEDNGTGNLYIDTNGAGINLSYNNSAENMASFTANGAATLYYDNAAKIATTNTGVDVTGTVTADGLELNGSNNALLAMRTTGDTDSQVMGTQYLNNSGAVTAQTFATGNSTSSSVFRIKAIGAIDLIGGDIGVTGAAPDLRIDSSGNVGIGTVPLAKLHVDSTNSAFYVGYGGNEDIYLQTTNGNVLFTDKGATSERMRIASNGLITFNNAAGSTETASKTGSVTPDLTTYQNFAWTLTGNITLSNPSTEVVGMSGVFIFIHSGAARTVSLGTDYKTAGAAGLTLSSAAGAVDIVPYFVQSTSNILLGTPLLAFS